MTTSQHDPADPADTVPAALVHYRSGARFTTPCGRVNVAAHTPDVSLVTCPECLEELRHEWQPPRVVHYKLAGGGLACGLAWQKAHDRSDGVATSPGPITCPACLTRGVIQPSETLELSAALEAELAAEPADSSFEVHVVLRVTVRETRADGSTSTTDKEITVTGLPGGPPWATVRGLIQSVKEDGFSWVSDREWGE